MATSHKHLKFADTNGKVVSDSPEGNVDTLPVWTLGAPYSVFFSRGEAAEYHYDPKKVMVPGQRIWQQAIGEKALQVTKGTNATADYYPAPSPDGKQLLFVRLDNAVHGSVFLSSRGKETELLRNVTGILATTAIIYLSGSVSIGREKQHQSQEPNRFLTIEF